MPDNLQDDLINIQDYEGNTPLHEAVSNNDTINNHIDIIEFLLSIPEIKLDIKNHKNKTAEDIIFEKFNSKEIDSSKFELLKQLFKNFRINQLSEDEYKWADDANDLKAEQMSESLLGLDAEE